MMYREEMSNLAANKATYDRLLEEERKANGSANLLSVISAFSGAPPQSPDAAASAPPSTGPSDAVPKAA
jgi:hypothetical protein